MTGDELNETLIQIQAFGRLCLNIPLDAAQAVLDEIERTDAFLPLIDPTGWMKIRDALPQHRAFVAAFVDMRRVLAELVEDDEAANAPEVSRASIDSAAGAGEDG